MDFDDYITITQDNNDKSYSFFHYFYTHEIEFELCIMTLIFFILSINTVLDMNKIISYKNEIKYLYEKINDLETEIENNNEDDKEYEKEYDIMQNKCNELKNKCDEINNKYEEMDNKYKDQIKTFEEKVTELENKIKTLTNQNEVLVDSLGEFVKIKQNKYYNLRPRKEVKYLNNEPDTSDSEYAEE